MKRLAVIDIGTNSIHMVLAEVSPDSSYKIVDRIKDMVRLGDGTFTSRRLSPEVMDRGLQVLKRYSALAKNKGFETMVAIATSAVREAKNGGDFIKLAQKDLGLKVRVITGEEEARLIYLGVRNSMDLSASPSLILDIGGGSVELLACTEKRLQFVHSLKLGAIRLKDQFLHSDPPAKRMVQRMERTIRLALTKALKSNKAQKYVQMVATSGMAGNITEIIHLARTGKPISQLDMATIELAEIKKLERLLQINEVERRSQIGGLDPRRADTLFPAVVVLRMAMEQAKLQSVRISEKAIREGVIYDFIQRHQEGLRAEQKIPQVRRRQILLLARRYQYPVGHSHHTANLAVSVFDQTRSLHALGEQEREWLEYAALLHDIGRVISENKHHKHTYYLMTHADLPGFSSEEIQIMANIARYHRQGMPKARHSGYRTLGLGLRRVVQVLSAILRIADGLDRSHFSIIRGVKVEIGSPVRMYVRCRHDPELELWMTERRKKLFEKVFRKPVELVVSVTKVKRGSEKK